MDQQLYIIANSRSGYGRGEQVLREVQQNLQQTYHIPYIIFPTQYKGHSIELTNQIISKHTKRPIQGIIVVGGDGTLHEVVETMLKAEIIIPIIYCAAGTGNDFVRTWEPKATVQSTLKQYFIHKKPITIPVFETYNHLTHQHNVILNSLGFGLDGKVIYEVYHTPQDSLIRKLFNGKFTYLINIFKAIRELDHFNVKIMLDQQKMVIEDCQFISLMNSPYLGGGIKLSNQVNPQEAIISLVAFKKVTLSKLIQLLWEILVNKKTPQSENYLFRKAQSVTVKIDDEVLSQVDGELRDKQSTHLSVKVNQYTFYL